MFVKEFGLFSTTFRRVDGQEIIAPNSLLSSSKLVHNLRRSSSMWETTEIQISYDTPLEVIEKLRQSLSNYIQENSREWSNTNMNIDTIQNQNVIHLIIGVERALLFLLILAVPLTRICRSQKLARLGRSMDSAHGIYETFEDRFGGARRLVYPSDATCPPAESYSVWWWRLEHKLSSSFSTRTIWRTYIKAG